MSFLFRLALRAAPRTPFWHARLAATTASFAAVTFSAGALGLKSIFPGTGPIDTSPLHASGSSADSAALAATAAALEKTSLYRSLSASPEWVEMPDTANSLSPAARATKLISGVLRGHRKISANRRFMHADGTRSTSVVSIGSALCGHPNVVHGGILATLLDEALGRVAIAQFPEGMHAVTARLEVNYRAPARAVDDVFNRDGFLVLTTMVVEKGERKVKVVGEIKEMGGKMLVQSEALFVVPRGWMPRPLSEH